WQSTGVVLTPPVIKCEGPSYGESVKKFPQRSLRPRSGTSLR
ncbi:hypothetical protein TNCV_2220741, partial [Trichonephila clavipes]